MPKTKEDIIRLRFMLEVFQKIKTMTNGKNRPQITTDEREALAHLIESLVESAARVSREMQQAHSAVLWREITILRHRLEHGDDETAFDLAWRFVTTDLERGLAPLQKAVEQEANEQGNPS
ncbi:MAG: DUF86 domain-containing protein [Ignavibacteriales bacterium]|nr:DUF86 domain-containing protein [Ignavibacteriales bacterium]